MFLGLRLFDIILYGFVKVLGVVLKALVVGVQAVGVGVVFAFVRNEINTVDRDTAYCLDLVHNYLSCGLKLADVARRVILSPDRSKAEDGSVGINGAELCKVFLYILSKCSLAGSCPGPIVSAECYEDIIGIKINVGIKRVGIEAAARDALDDAVGVEHSGDLICIGDGGCRGCLALSDRVAENEELSVVGMGSKACALVKNYLSDADVCIVVGEENGNSVLALGGVEIYVDNAVRALRLKLAVYKELEYRRARASEVEMRGICEEIKSDTRRC